VCVSETLVSTRSRVGASHINLPRLKKKKEKKKKKNQWGGGSKHRHGTRRSDVLATRRWRAARL